MKFNVPPSFISLPKAIARRDTNKMLIDLPRYVAPSALPSSATPATGWLYTLVIYYYSYRVHYRALSYSVFTDLHAIKLPLADNIT